MAEDQNSFELVESREAIELIPQRDIPAWWFAVALAVILIVVGLTMIFSKTNKPIDPRTREREAFSRAKEAFGSLGTKGVRDTAVSVSQIMRRYLADAMDEPALFETHEEFVSRHDVLKDYPEELKVETGNFFSQLAAVKYAPEIPDGCDSCKIAEGGMKILERMHAA